MRLQAKVKRPGDLDEGSLGRGGGQRLPEPIPLQSPFPGILAQELPRKVHKTVPSHLPSPADMKGNCSLKLGHNELGRARGRGGGNQIRTRGGAVIIFPSIALYRLVTAAPCLTTLLPHPPKIKVKREGGGILALGRPEGQDR